MQISEILQQRIEQSRTNETLQRQLELEGKEYHLRWLNGVQCFVNQLNKEQVEQGKRNYRFMEIYIKLEHIKEIDDLRWFYKQCLAYKNRIDQFGNHPNTFGKLFWGALKLR